MKCLPSVLACLVFGSATTLASTALAQAPYPNLARDLAATCANCHGTGGVSAGDVPSLAAQPKDELIRKMQAYKSGAAPGTIMQQIAKGYTDPQIELLAGWFANQKGRSR